jgi:hypothetical protein
MKIIRKAIALTIVLLVNASVSNAQKHNDSCTCHIIGFFATAGSSLPTNQEKNPSIAGSIGFAYLTKIGNFGIDWGFNIFTLSKENSYTVSNVVALYSYSLKYRNEFSGSHRLSYGVSLDFNENHVPEGFINEKETGIGASVELGYYFALTKVGAFGLSANYQYAKLSKTDFSNVGLKLQYAAPWLSWKRK